MNQRVRPAYNLTCNTLLNLLYIYLNMSQTSKHDSPNNEVSVCLSFLLSLTHSFTLSLQAQNLPFQQILSTVDFFYLLDCLTITRLDRTYHAHHYGRPLSVSGRPCYILPMFFYLFFLWPPYSPALVNGGSLKFYTWWTLSVIEEVITWIFLVILKLQGGPKSDEISHIFRPRPQTFCSHARTRQNIVILKKNLLSTDGFFTTYATFGELWPTNP